MVGLHEGKNLRICSAVSTEYRRVTNGQKKQTSCDSVVRAMHTRHMVMNINYTVCLGPITGLYNKQFPNRCVKPAFRII